MKTQSSSTPSPVSSPKIPLSREMSQNSTLQTPPNTRMLSPPGAPLRRRFIRPEVASQSDGAFRSPHNLRDRPNGGIYSPTPRRGRRGRDARSRSPPRDRSPAYRNRSLANSRLLSGRSIEEASLGPLIESIERDTVTDDAQPSSSHNMNERFQSMLSLADAERKEQATGCELSGLPNTKSLRTKSKDLDPSNSEKIFKHSSDEDRKLWSKKSSN